MECGVNQSVECNGTGELNLGDGDCGHGSLGNTRQPGVAILLQSVAQEPELLGGLSLLVDGSVVVIAGHIGSKAGAVGASPVAKRGTAMSHVEREADASLQHLVDAGNHVGRWACLVTGSPLIEPAAPELRAHERRVGTHLLEAGKLLVDIAAGAKVHSPQQVVETIKVEIARPVTLEQCEVGTIQSTQSVAYLTHILLVLTIRAILVLDLHHDDGPTMSNGEREKLLCNLGFKPRNASHEIRVALAQAYVLLLEQPPWQATHLPLGTHIGAGTHNNIHAVLLRQSAELGYVVVASEVKLALLGLVDIPEHIQAQRVHAQCLAHLDAVFPVGTRNAGIMHLGSLDDKRLAIEQESIVANHELVTQHTSRYHASRSMHAHCHHDSNKHKKESQTVFHTTKVTFFIATTAQVAIYL